MDSAWQKLRAATLSRTPTPLRLGLKLLRDRVQRAESRLRARLPPNLGGRFDSNSASCRQLGSADLDALRRLRPISDERATNERGPTHELVEGRACFCVGVFVDGQLVGAGYCLGVADAQTPFREALYLADFVRPAFRRRGLARSLHAARLKLLAARGGQTAYAWVDPENKAALACFRASGFDVVPRDEIPATLQRPGARHLLLSRAV